MKPYFSLLVRQDDKWCIEFGDYDLDAVLTEQAYTEGMTMIMQSLDTQESIDKVLEEFNNMEPRVLDHGRDLIIPIGHGAILMGIIPFVQEKRDDGLCNCCVGFFRRPPELERVKGAFAASTTDLDMIGITFNTSEDVDKLIHLLEQLKEIIGGDE